MILCYCGLGDTVPLTLDKVFASSAVILFL